MVDRTMRGLYPILAMPFDEKGRIDVDDLQREVEFCIERGAHGLGVALASEVFKLSEVERDLALKAVVEQSRGRAKIVMNTGAQGTDLAVQYSQRAEELGADAVMVIPPTAIPTSGAQVREYYRRISDAISIPIFIQDVSSAPVPPAMAVQIARESENACYAKVETPPTSPRVAEAKQLGGNDLIIFGGAGGNFFVEEMRRGAVGTMPASAIPEVFRKTWDLFHSGKEDEAQRYFEGYQPLLKFMGQGLGLSYYLTKEVMRLRGVFKTAYVRHPAQPPDEIAYRELRSLVESLELEVVKA